MHIYLSINVTSPSFASKCYNTYIVCAFSVSNMSQHTLLAS